MFEDYVLYLLKKYLGEYVHGLSTELLRISVWKGDVVLKDLKLRAEALNSLKLPVIVRAGFIGSITLKVPWKSLGKEPVVVLIDRVFILAHSFPGGQSLQEEDREKLFEAKLKQIEETEQATLEASTKRSKFGRAPGGNSWFGSLVATIIGNLKISISNVHIRYEDILSNPGHPFCCGITLSKLAAFTTDEEGNETFDTSGALDKLRKCIQLQRLAVYHDSHTTPWKFEKKWEEFNPTEWTEIFVGNHGISPTAAQRNYLVSPIDGILKYHRIGKQERHETEVPLERATLVISDVSLAVTEAQYYDCIKLAESFSRYRARIEVSHLRPTVQVTDDPKIWWRYFAQASLQQKKMCYRFSWERIKDLCHCRRKYVQLYACSLQKIQISSSEIRKIEKDLDSKVILLWRLLAHAKVESVKSKLAAQQQSDPRRSWLSLRWLNSPQDVEVTNNLEENVDEEKKLSKEEWEAVNRLLSYYNEEDEITDMGKGSQTMLHLLVDVSIGQAAARVFCINQTEILCGRFEQLHVTTKMYQKTMHYDLSLKFYGLSSPEGSLIQSFSNERKANALAATFVQLPAEEVVDWRLSATIAPCHVTVWMKSYERFLEFVKRSNAISPEVAQETAAALQMKFEKVARRAQEQFQIVLEEKNRFSLDIDFDAPKVSIPLTGTELPHTEDFFLDFGHFTLHTRENEREEERQSLYSRFYIVVRDITAFFVDSKTDIMTASGAQILEEEPYTFPEDRGDFYSLIDRCGMSVVIDMIKIAHPRYPSTRVSLQVPSLNIHFSPARYGRVISLLDILNGPRDYEKLTIDGYLDATSVPWYPAELAANARILVWRGIGNSFAEWKPCFVILSGLYLYILESETSQNFQRCANMGGRQVFEVPPISIGGSLYSIAVGWRGMDVQKALESSTTLIIEFQEEAEKTAWLKGLVLATYRASAPPAIDILGENIHAEGESSGTPISNQGNADLIINGALLETSISIYGNVESKNNEEILLEILAAGGKVNVVRCDADLIVKMKLHSFKIKDELQTRCSSAPQFLACSVLTDNMISRSLSNLQNQGRPFNTFFPEEDDNFRDALPDFASTSDFSPRTCGSEIGDVWSVLDSSDFLSLEKDWTRRKSATEIFYEIEDSSVADFIAVSFLTRSPDSPYYEGIDTQMSVCMSKLDFFCNRPTLVALIEFGADLSLANSAVTSEVENRISEDLPLQGIDKSGENGGSAIKGLLGHGKGRVVFSLTMDVDSVSVYLNNEDGSQLAMFVQECFLLHIKIHPNSMYIDGTLGNLRICDLSLGPEHHWGWLCDLQNQGVESLVKFTFQSYSIADDDYTGYDYSLHGQLSCVRIIFLYRFVQEITSYFMELGTPRTEEAVKLVDKVGDFESLIQKYEIDGASSVKLDLFLDTPIIVIPQHSSSKDFVQLDLGQLHLSNSISWHGCQEEDPSAVHMDILDIEVSGVNMAVGMDRFLGKPMIREEKGFHIQIRRSLRDVFRRVPTFYVDVRVGLLHCIMTEKEYKVILDCASSNLSEEPRLPPSFRSSPLDSMRILADKVQHSSQVLLSRTIAIFSIEIQTALLDLCNGFDEESQLAHIALEGLWLSYQTTSLAETDLYLSIPRLSVLDIRHGTKPEMQLMLGSSSDASGQAIYSNHSIAEPSNNFFTKSAEREADGESPMFTMLIMDYHLRSSSQSLVIRVQQPRILVVLDFILPVVEFFVPSLGVVTGRDEMMHPENDPFTKSKDIVLSQSIYFQTSDIVYLSPQKRLIVDGCGVDEFIYDGCHGTVHLITDSDMKNESFGTHPLIILIGRGKKLRFRNVKIENGDRLRNCTYLANDSSYSVSADDGVEIFFYQTGSTSVEENLNDPGRVSLNVSDAAFATSSPFSQIKNTSFEIQVLSPEFTFYDSTKLSMDDSLLVEKLLRAKLDINFMYAAKENDTWVRALVKDFTVEAGSGLVIMDPVDLSGGFSSTKDKTNISIVSSDLCVHLSLSVASLLLQLENQATTALQFGNTRPLATCTNFKQIWVSNRGKTADYNLTFWRPQAPSNFVILGDCVTSRPVPPSQVVMAVSNVYGRVRKPVGFKLICSVSDILSLEEVDTNNECYLWMPIAPSGYSAVGCVAQTGKKPPSINVVHCIRSDLVSSTTFSDCVISLSPNQRDPSGFSIWRIDNSIGSFCAHLSVNRPREMVCLDLHQMLISYSSMLMGLKHASRDSLSQRKEKNLSSSRSSGWDIVRSLSKSSCHSVSTPHFERMWWDKNSESGQQISIWRPIPRPGFSALGDCIVEGLEPPGLGLLFKCDNSELSARPVQFTKVSHMRKGPEEVFFWFPIAPPGYVSMGCAVTRTDEAPRKDLFCCPRMDLVLQANVSENPISRSSSSKGSNCWSIWKVENQACTFLARPDMKKPSNRLAYSIEDSVKPRARENISVEMKLGCFSLSILDSMQRMLTPLLDLTITNVNLATHGRPDSLSAALICSIAASSFNRQLEAWEPLIEPFDGIFKVETFNTNEISPSRFGKRLRVSTTTPVNVNISAANLETLTELILSWRRQIALEQKSSQRDEEPDAHSSSPKDLVLSALEEDDSRRIVVENKLGRDVYLRTMENKSENIVLLKHDKQALVTIPPPRFTNQVNIADKSGRTRHYVAIRIFDVKGLPIKDDGNAHDFFCALRLVIDIKAEDRSKIFPQSARTRVRRVFSRDSNGNGLVKWDEVFIFEIPEKSMAKVEVEVTNLAARAGKGEMVGGSSIPIGNGVNMLKRVASIRMLQKSDVTQNFSVYPLRNKINGGSIECGHLSLSTAFFERSSNAVFQAEKGDKFSSDTGFCVSLDPHGPWESFGTLLPVSVIPRSINKQSFAFEVLIKSGRKHTILRPLAVVSNDTKVNIEVSTYPASNLLSSSSTRHSSTPETEEIFENQHYHPDIGWLSNFDSYRNIDTAQWSNRDFSLSSKGFFEPPLLPGWRWASPWTIEKPSFADNDGWAYGPDFLNLKWPPSSSASSSKRPLDYVRRRRWLRKKQRTDDSDDARNIFSMLNPGSSAILPWSSIQHDSDLCLQIRPRAEYPEDEYEWGYTITSVSSSTGHSDDGAAEKTPLFRQSSYRNKKASVVSCLKLNQIEKKDFVMCCPAVSSQRQNFFLSVGADASILHTDLNSPVYDWVISINAPLKLENKLPYNAEFAIWEKTVAGNRVERHRGVLSASSSEAIYTADIRRPIYLTLFIQGGWAVEKDSILILDMTTLEHPPSFWIFHQESKRRLRVNIERDMGGTDAATKVVRFFVPYWIHNDTCLKLRYQAVEIESLGNADSESVSAPNTAKSARFSSKQSFKAIDLAVSSLSVSQRKDYQILEMIEDSGKSYEMLSPQDYVVRSGILPFSSRSDSTLSPRIGISVAVSDSGNFSPGVSLTELENKGRINIKAFDADRMYYKLSALITMASDRTKVVCFQHQIMFINRLGEKICLKQSNSDMEEWIHPSDPPRVFKWNSTSLTELLMVHLDGYKWSSPFSVENEGMIWVLLKSDLGKEPMNLRVEIRSGAKHSSFEVIFRLGSTFSSPYRIENRSMFLPLRIRQLDGFADSWISLPPNTSISFYWEDLSRQRVLEVLVDGSDPLSSQKITIDKVIDHQLLQISSGGIRPLSLSILKEGKIFACRISDWMPDDDDNMTRGSSPSTFPYHSPQNDYGNESSPVESELHIVLELSDFGLSIFDHTPEEILYLSIQYLLISYSTGIGSGFSRFKMQLRGIQVDNQLPFTPMPVLLRMQRIEDHSNHVIKFSMTKQESGSLDLCLYPYIGVQVPENSAFLVNIHEPIIWRLHEMFQQSKFNQISGSKTSDVPVDPIVQIRLFNASEVRFRVSMAMSPALRPRGVLGFWSSLMTALGNTEHMPVRINQRFHEDICMRQSALISSAVSSINKDLLTQPLQLLSGVDILGNASSALGHMSRGIAALSMDKKFIQGRQKQESKGVEDLGDVIREGGGALAKGLFRGVTGILTKPLEGAKSSGVEGFVQGVGKGIIGAAAQPVSGVLDLLSKTTEGANAVKMKLASALTSEEHLSRRRLSRAIGGDSLLRPYDDYKAVGQVILQLAESGTFLGQVDLFKVRGKFALSDAYEDHFMLPKAKILMVTHRRVILLQQPSSIAGQKKFNPAKDACSVMWDIPWEELMTMELANKKSEHAKSPPSILILYLKSRPSDSKDSTRIVECHHESSQAMDIYSSIQKAMSTYGSNHAGIVEPLKRKVKKPYSPRKVAVTFPSFEKEEINLGLLKN